jgi:hypothetical protein
MGVQMLVGGLCQTPWPQASTISDGAGFFQRLVSAVFVNRLKTTGSNTDAHKLLEFRHPDSLVTQIWREDARHHLSDVPAYAAFFLGQTTPVNDAAAHGP